MSEKKEIVCELIRADVPTENGNIYSNEVLDKAVEQFNKASKRDTCFVVSDAEPDGRVMLSKVAAKVHHIQLRDGQLVCQLEMLDTPAGKDIQNILEQCTITPLAYGSITDGKVSADDLNVYGFSFVYNNPKK